MEEEKEKGEEWLEVKTGREGGDFGGEGGGEEE